MNSPQPAQGAIAWCDLTVSNADAVSMFYEQVAGWTPRPHDMGDYHDYEMHDAGGQCVAGICHARGSNAQLPAQWLIYISVADVDAAAQRCTELGGRILDGPRAMGPSRFCVVRDPAGAVAALISPTPADISPSV